MQSRPVAKIINMIRKIRKLLNFGGITQQKTSAFVILCRDTMPSESAYPSIYPPVWQTPPEALATGSQEPKCLGCGR